MAPAGRLYVIGGDKPFTYGATGVVINGKSSIYEVRKKANGSYSNVSIVDGNSTLTPYALTPYAICCKNITYCGGSSHRPGYHLP